MIWFAIIAAAALAAALVWWTFGNTNRMQSPFAFKEAVAIILTLGIFPGSWIGYNFRYTVSDSVELQGFPIPLVFFALEEGRWIDNIRHPPLGLLNVFLIDSIFLTPLALAMFVVLLRRRAAGTVYN